MMKKALRILALVMALGMVIGVLCACSDPAGESETESVEVPGSESQGTTEETQGGTQDTQGGTQDTGDTTPPETEDPNPSVTPGTNGGNGGVWADPAQ